MNRVCAVLLGSILIVACGGGGGVVGDGEVADRSGESRNIQAFFAFLQKRDFADGRQDHRGIIGLAENGFSLPNSEVASATLSGPNGFVTSDGNDGLPVFYRDQYRQLDSWNPETGSFERIIDLNETGIIFSQQTSSLDAGNYTFSITLTDGTVYAKTVNFPGTVSTPLVQTESISYNWRVDGSLDIAWVEPARAFDQYRVVLTVDDKSPYVFVRLFSKGVSSITIPSGTLDYLLAGSSDADIETQIQTRLYSGSQNYSRSYTNVVSIPLATR